jgi:hypothetical protein
MNSVTQGENVPPNTYTGVWLPKAEMIALAEKILGRAR